MSVSKRIDKYGPHMTPDVFCVEVTFLLLQRTGLMTKEESDFIMNKVQGGMFLGDVYQLIEELTRK